MKRLGRALAYVAVLAFGTVYGIWFVGSAVDTRALIDGIPVQDLSGAEIWALIADGHAFTQETLFAGMVFDGRWFLYTAFLFWPCLLSLLLWWAFRRVDARHRKPFELAAH